MFRRIDYSKRLPDIDVPVLILVGRHDLETPFECSLQLDEGIRDSTLVVFESSGHIPFIEEPERFAHAVRAFLTR